MTEQEFKEILHEALVMYAEEGSIIEGIRTYEQEQFLSTHSGLMVRLKNGEVFNLMVWKDASNFPGEEGGKPGCRNTITYFKAAPSGTDK